MKKISLLIFSSFLCSPAFGADINVPSEIYAVTVFPDRADISRSAQTDLPAGKHTLVFNDLPAGLMTDSLRVSGKGNAAFTIGSVETKQIFTTDLAVAEEKKIQDKIAALRDERRFIEAQIKAADTGKAFLENMTRGGIPRAAGSEENSAQALSPDVWKNAWQTIQNGMNTLGKETIEKQIRLRSVDNDVAALQNQLRRISTGRKSYKQVRANVETDKPVKASVVLQYQIAGAFWNPLYEARLDSAKETVNIIQYGDIVQKTGEDWNNVALTLSTARPSVTMQPPVLSPVWLNLKDNERIVYQKTMKAAGPALLGRATNFAAVDEVAFDAAAEAGSLMDETEDAAFSGASAIGTEFSGVFAIKGLSNVPSDGSEYRFNIGNYSIPAEIRAESYPAADASAYLIATLVFNGDLPLLPGNIALFRDGAFIGNSYLDLLRPNEKLHLAFGQDEKIRIAYTSLGGETTEGGVIARETKKDVLSKTNVQNLHRRPIKIAVYEQIPVSRNSDIAVKIIKDKTTPDYIINPNDKVGLIKWESVYQPQEKKEINYGYSVSWPKERTLTGL